MLLRAARQPCSREDDARDEEMAIARLATAAAASTAQRTADIRGWFEALSTADKQVFVHKIVVLDAATPATDLRAAVQMELWWGLPREGRETFLDLLWSWWEEVTLDMLQRRRGSISLLEAQDRIREIRDKFAPDNLPTVIELADVDDGVVAVHESRLFVAQMQWVHYAHPNVRRAIVDYYRAVEQTTRWVADDLVGLAELRKFEDNLHDEWERAFDDMIDDLGVDADDNAKVVAGKELLRRLIDSTAVTVRSRYNDRFFARGKRHELADTGQAGWHPDFRTLIEALLAPAG